MQQKILNQFQQDGYFIVANVLEVSLIADLNKAIAEYQALESTHGIRDLHYKISAISELATSSLIINTLQKYTDFSQFQLIKAIFFNKNLTNNWSVGWHQDKTIAVSKKQQLSGYINWTVKQHIPHVQPPLDVLEQITTLRIALNDANSNNGALKIIPQSHNLGILNQQQINQIIKKRQAVTCCLNAGDVLMIHPLILHSSGKSKTHQERSTIHLEYCSYNLPQSLIRI